MTHPVPPGPDPGPVASLPRPARPARTTDPRSDTADSDAADARPGTRSGSPGPVAAAAGT